MSSQVILVLGYNHTFIVQDHYMRYIFYSCKILLGDFHASPQGKESNVGFQANVTGRKLKKP